MASIATSIELYDRVSAPVNHILGALSSLMRGYEAVDKAMASGMDTTHIEEARAAIENAVNEVNNLHDAIQNTNSEALAPVEQIEQMNAGLQEAVNGYEDITQEAEQTESTIRENTTQQETFNRSLAEGVSGASNLNRMIAKVGATIGGIFTVKKAIDFFKSSMEAFDTQLNAERQLINVLGNMVEDDYILEVAADTSGAISEINAIQGNINDIVITPQMKTNAVQKQFDSISKKASEIQSLGIYGDEAMIAGAAELATYFSDAEAITTMMDTLSNYAAGMSGGGEVNTQQMVDYATNLGKIMTGAYDAMTKKGFEFTDAQKAVIEGTATEAEYAAVLGEQYQDLSDDMRAAAAISQVIDESWAGLYQTISNTPQGKVIALKNAFGDIKEELVAAVIPACMQLMQTIQDNMPEIREIILSLATPIQIIVGLINKVIEVASQAYHWFADNWSKIAPIIMGITTALIACKTAQLIFSAISKISSISFIAGKTAETAAIGVETAAIGGATAAQSTFNAVCAANPLLLIIELIIIAVIALMVVFALFTQEIVGTLYALGALFKNIGLWCANLGLAIAAVATNIAQIAVNIWNVICNTVEAIGLTVANVFDGIAAVVVQVFENLKTIIENVISGLGQIFSNIGQTIVNVFDAVGAVIGQVIENLGTVFENIGTGISQVFTNIGLTVSSIASAIWAVITTVISNIGGEIENVALGLEQVATNIGQTVSNVASAIAAVVGQIVSNIGQTISNVASGIWAVIQAVAANIGQIISKTATAIGAVIKQIGTNIGNGVANVAEAIWAVIQTVFHNIGSLAKNIAEALKGVFEALGTNIKAAMNNAWVRIQQVFWEGVDGVLQSVKKIAEGINTLLGWTGLVNIDTSGLDAAKDKAEALNGDLQDYVDIGAAWEAGMNTYSYEDLGAAWEDAINKHEVNWNLGDVWNEAFGDDVDWSNVTDAWNNIWDSNPVDWDLGSVWQSVMDKNPVDWDSIDWNTNKIDWSNVSDAWEKAVNENKPDWNINWESTPVNWNNVTDAWNNVWDSNPVDWNIDWGDMPDWSNVADAWDKGYNTNDVDWDVMRDWEDVDWSNVSDAFKTFDTFDEGWWDNAYAEGAAVGADIQNWINDNISIDGLMRLLGVDTSSYENSVEDILNNPAYDSSAYTPAGGYDAGQLPSNVAGIADDTANISDSLDITTEDLKYLRDIAERDVINRFTTAEIKVEMNNTNNISNENDLDGMIDYLANGLLQTMTKISEGVHS